MLRLRGLFGALCLAVGLALSAPPVAGPALAQEAAQQIDYKAWDKDATSAEDVIAAARASSKALEDLRARIADWRSLFDPARSANAQQIETLKSQIAAIGPAPADGATEAPEIARRRLQLNDLLGQAQAPSLAAVEAFSRADGIIRQIDALVHERQANALLKLMPSPLNPLHWPSGLAVLTQGINTLWDEVQSARESAARRIQFRDNLPLSSLCVVLAVLLMWRGAPFMERLSLRMQARAALRARNAIAALVSLGQIAVPVLGMGLLLIAILKSGYTGPRIEALCWALPKAAFAFYSAKWLGSWLLPTDERAPGLRLTERAAEARLLVAALGATVALEIFRSAFTTEVRPPLSQAAQAMWLAPLVCLASVFLFRLGQLLRRQRSTDTAPSGEAVMFRRRIIALVGTLAALVAAATPILALIGYVAAANALLWPTIGTLALLGLILLLQRFLTDIYLLVTRSGEEGREALMPVLLGFLLTLASLPALALIWGARLSYLAEIWEKFKAGVSVGGTQISPLAILLFFVVFVLGYMLTRLLQGAMRAAVMPRTTLDKGAQNATVAGLGYVGIFLSGMVAVNAAGIDLSSLAIVAGALSVGIGFGLQNIVQNFISGIILLVERPISEGDTIEVGAKSGVVRSISVRSTRLITPDQAEVIVPNAEFISGVVTNWTRESLNGRLIMPVVVKYGSDTRKVEAVLKAIVEDQPLVLIDPEPSVYFMGFSPDGLLFEIRAILSDLNFKLDVQSDINHAIVQRFAEEGIEIPLGHQRIILSRDEPQAAFAHTPRLAGEGAPTAQPKADASAIFNDPHSDPDESERT